MTADLASFMATMIARSQPLSLERAAALVLEGYGLGGSVTKLSGERDENFKLTADSGAEYLLKIAHPAEQPLVTQLPIAALRHVARSDPMIPCPRVVAARGGASQIRFVDENGGERLAYLLTFLPGRVLAATTRSRPQRTACGRVAGRLSCALRDFKHPAARRVIIWDLQHVSRVGGLLAQVGDFRDRQRAFDLLTDIVPRVESQWSRLRQQVVHNDLNALNILVDAADEARVTGIIDFGDLTHTALVADVAVTAAENIPEEASDLAAARTGICEIAAAYHDSVPLLEPELAVLGTLVAARLVTILVVHAWHLHHNPGGGHYAPFAGEFIRARMEIARGLLREETRL